MSLVETETLEMDSSPFLTFGTMLLSNINNIIILKCNFCQKELCKLKDFLQHISRHIGGLNDEVIGNIITELQEPEPSVWIHGYNINDENTYSPHIDDSKTDYSDHSGNVNNAFEKSEDIIDIVEDSEFMDDFIEASDIESIKGNQVASLNDLDQQEIDNIEVDANISEEDFNIEPQVYDDFIAEEQSLDGEYCNEVYLEPQTNEDSNSSGLEDKSDDQTNGSNFLHESGSGFEVEFLEAKKSAIDNHNAKANKNFICMICKKVCTSRSAYQNHLKRHSKAKIHTCEICQAVFKDVSNLKVHRNRHLRVQPHACELCDKTFTTTTELKIHIRSHTGEKPYICDYCGVGYSTSSHLTSHRYRHFQIRRHKCNICDKAYFIKEDLRSHMRTHTNERPFECGECGRTFSRLKSYKQHKDLHLSEKKFKCNCGKTFAQSAGLYLHKKTCKHIY